VNEQIECISACISAGAARARKVPPKMALALCGNTGAGKSTLVNYVHGCMMEQVSLECERKIIRTSEKSKVAELMLVGHSNQSATFIQGVESDEQFTYIDCPGFLDNRSAEINISNAVNIKQVLDAAESVVVVVVLNYYALKADRCRGLKDLAAIISKMFGNAERLAEHKESIALVISQVPICGPYGEPFDIRSLEGMVKDSSGLTPYESDVVKSLWNGVFAFDLLDRCNGSPGWKSRYELIALFRDLKPIKKPSSVFKTVLTKNDESVLRNIVEEMCNRVSAVMGKEDYKIVGVTLTQLHRIELLGNPFVKKIIEQAAVCVQCTLDNLKHSVANSISPGDLDEADYYVGKLRNVVDGIRRWAPRYSSVAEEALKTVVDLPSHHRQKAKEHDALIAEESKAKDYEELSQMQHLEIFQAYVQEVRLPRIGPSYREAFSKIYVLFDRSLWK